MEIHEMKLHIRLSAKSPNHNTMSTLIKPPPPGPVTVSVLVMSYVLGDPKCFQLLYCDIRRSQNVDLINRLVLRYRATVLDGYALCRKKVGTDATSRVLFLVPTLTKRKKKKRKTQNKLIDVYLNTRKMAQFSWLVLVSRHWVLVCSPLFLLND
ncbi:hypothetical protein BD289DRAFT_236476 [Coniella lustricola]|uniref:Uncharacterized protein n=1 Tax=Coniella lustricola TaxID=2025994 RepID=A0A2T3A9P2_9PEZI|nr:hypothetical protein BD289DRAFT_236476 [Coniella lustricola]